MYVFQTCSSVTPFLGVSYMPIQSRCKLLLNQSGVKDPTGCQHRESGLLFTLVSVTLQNPFLFQFTSVHWWTFVQVPVLSFVKQHLSAEALLKTRVASITKLKTNVQKNTCRPIIRNFFLFFWFWKLSFALSGIWPKTRTFSCEDITNDVLGLKDVSECCS